MTKPRSLLGWIFLLVGTMAATAGFIFAMLFYADIAHSFDMSSKWVSIGAAFFTIWLPWVALYQFIATRYGI